MRLKCPKCKHTWNYKGKANEEDYVCCPKCRLSRKKKNFIIVSNETTEGESKMDEDDNSDQDEEEE